MASQPSHDTTSRESADCFLGTLLDAPSHARRPMLDALKTSDPDRQAAAFAVAQDGLKNLDTNITAASVDAVAARTLHRAQVEAAVERLDTPTSVTRDGH